LKSLNLLKNPDFVDGLKAMVEPAMAIVAWSIVTNIALLSAGLKPLQTFWFNILVYAGSAQLAVMPLIAGDYPLWTVWLTALIVNLRFVIFSAGLQPHFKNYPLLDRLGLGFINGDIPFVKFMHQFPPTSAQSSQTALMYFLGVSLMNWAVWQVGVLIAIIFGVYIPKDWGVGFAGTLALIALIVPAIKNKTALISALAAGVTCALTINLPYRLTIVSSVIAGVAAAILMDKRCGVSKA
jgi:predicted branched-subunit amino acid permease